MVTVEYSCADGSPFPVVFESEADSKLEWRLDCEHVPDSQSTLAEAVGRRLGPGGRRAYEENGMRPMAWRPGPRASGFLYFDASPPDPEDVASLFEGGARLIQQYGSALSVWRDQCLPRAQSACAWLNAAPSDATFDELADQYEYALHQTMVAGMISSNDRRLLQESVADAMGPENAESLSTDLWHGYDSPTLAGDIALWRVARGESDLDEFMALYGDQATTWSVDAPTLREAPEIVHAQLDLLRRVDTEDPQKAIDSAARRRVNLVAEIDARLADDETRRARFHRRVERASAALWMSEDRALWQLIAVGELRHAFLRRGNALAGDGVIDAPHDVLYLDPTEFDDETGDLRERVRARRAAHTRWRAAAPPMVIGGGARVGGRDDTVLHGTPGAPGIAEGRACVIVDLVDADRLGVDDVLVCTMTSPPWTPLFAVAAAVVTDSGDATSHSAIAAREYGLPCVVGTESATVVISNGMTVRVDGDKGTVEIAGE